MLGLARRDKSDAAADVLNGTRAAQPFDLVESIPNYDLPFRATVYDLVFSYTVRPGDVGNLAHSGRGALHVEVSPFHLVNGTIEVNKTDALNQTYLGREQAWLEEAAVCADAGRFGSIRRATNGAMLTAADTRLRGAHDLEAQLGAHGTVRIDRQWRSADGFPTKVELVVRGLAHPTPPIWILS